jgi:hypothetical protein
MDRHDILITFHFLHFMQRCNKYHYINYNPSHFVTDCIANRTLDNPLEES